MAKRSGHTGSGGNRRGGRGPGMGGGRGQRTGGEMQGGQQERMRGTGGGGPQREQGLLAGAREMAGNFGEMAGNFGETTAETARQFASKAKDAATTVGRGTQQTVSQAVGKVRENPWPSLLIGAGVTWLAVDAIRGRSSDSEAGGAHSRRDREESGPGLVRRTASSIAGAGRGAGESIGGFVRDRPLLAGAATLGIGMAVGLAMPSSSGEDSVMGNMRDGVVRRAREAARGTVEAVRDVAEGVERMAGGGNRERTK